MPEDNDFCSDDVRGINSRSTEGQGAVAIILGQTTPRTVDKICSKGERLIMVKVKGKSVEVVTVQMYMPMTEYKDEEVDAVYETTEELLDKESKGKDSRLIMGGWNAVDREGKRDMFVGHYGSGYRNDREKLVEFCQQRQTYVTNT